MTVTAHLSVCLFSSCGFAMGIGFYSPLNGSMSHLKQNASPKGPTNITVTTGWPTISKQLQHVVQTVWHFLVCVWIVGMMTMGRHKILSSVGIAVFGIRDAYWGCCWIIDSMACSGLCSWMRAYGRHNHEWPNVFCTTRLQVAHNTISQTKTKKWEVIRDPV